jgi:cytochrome c-type biogenesis protein CcmH/NrfF
LAVVLAAATVQVGSGQSIADIENPKVDGVAEKMNCSCGCKLNMACRMEPWPCQVCRKNKIKIAAMQASGKSDKEILDQFVAENGKDVLVVPPGIIGSALSYSALAIGLAMVIWIIRRYRRPMATPAGSEVDPAVLARIEKDTANLD